MEDSGIDSDPKQQKLREDDKLFSASSDSSASSTTVGTPKKKNVKELHKKLERRIEQAKKIHVKGVRDHESRRGLIPIQRLSIPSKTSTLGIPVGSSGGGSGLGGDGQAVLGGSKDSINLQLKRENQPLVEWDTDERNGNGGPPTKKARQGRSSLTEMEYMVDYFIQHPHVATGKCNAQHGGESLNGSWEELVKTLNAMRRSNIKGKDKKSWQVCWRDLKSKVSKKVSAIYAAQKPTGIQNQTPAKLTVLEKKVLGVIGYDYIKGIDEVLDSVPEVINMNEIMDGEHYNSVNKVAPTSLTVRPLAVNSSDSIDVFSTPTDDRVTVYLDGRMTEELNSSLMESQSSPNEALHNFMPPARNASVVSGIRGPNGDASTSRPRMKSRKKVLRHRLGTQLKDVKITFARLAKAANDNIKMIAEATKQQAEASAQMANAMIQLAHNERVRNEMLQVIIENSKKSTDVLQTAITALEFMADVGNLEEEIHFFPVSSSAGKGNIPMGRQVLTDTFSIEGLDLSGEEEEEEDDDDEDDLNLVPPKLHYHTCTCCVLPVTCGCAIM